MTFYDSPVSIRDTVFSNNMSEDGLNLVRSDFSISGVLFERTMSDAFDSDFSDGSITDTSFIEPGNDGIDVSGSDLVVRNVTVTGTGDKGLSGGENSRVKVYRISVKGSNIGIASKDFSEVILDGVKLSGCEYGFAAYQKKPEFGPASIKAINAELDNVKDEFLVEEGSSLTVNGNPKKNFRKGVLALLYGNEEE